MDRSTYGRYDCVRNYESSCLIHRPSSSSRTHHSFSSFPFPIEPSLNKKSFFYSIAMGLSHIAKITGCLVVLLSVAVYQLHARYHPNTPCAVDPPIVGTSFRGNPFSWDNSCHLYSLEYEEARQKFRREAQQRNADLFRLPIVVDNDGGGELLTTDIAILKGNRPGFVIHSSGTHGIEGYAGSAIQLALLAEGVLPLSSSSSSEEEEESSRPTIIFIHAINPYGMKHYRRFNENNVDLNRNAIIRFEEFLQNRDPNIAGYEQFRHFMSPPRAPSAWYIMIGWWCTALPLLLQEGYTALKRVLVAGQYHHPEGVFYGGTELQPSISKLLEFLQEKLSHSSSSSSSSDDDQTMIWIDVHSGLGKFGKDTLIFEETEKSVSKLRDLFPVAEHIVTADVSDKKAMSGYELTKGIVLNCFRKILLVHNMQSGSVTKDDTLGNPFSFSSSSEFVTQEFGTQPGILVGRALMLENAIHQHHHDDDDGRLLLGRQFIQSAFYPQSAKWRASIVQRGVAAMLQAIEYVNNQSSDG